MDAYHVYECVGTGSFGKVYRGRRKYTGQFVALKVIPKIGKTEADLRLLRTEAKILRQLDHVNIILLLDHFETASDIVLVTEFAHGELLQILQDDHVLPPAVVQSIARQLTSALHYLHDHRIMHRDLKPQNVLVSSGGVVKLCDFGFAAELSSASAMLASIKGTPLYLAPEVFSGRGEYDLRADIWSLGVVLYELALGRPPFFAATLPELMRLIAETPAPSFPSGAVPADLEDLLRRMLVKDPAMRAGWREIEAHPFMTAETSQESLTSETIEETTEKRIEPAAGSNSAPPPLPPRLRTATT